MSERKVFLPYSRINLTSAQLLVSEEALPGLL